MILLIAFHKTFPAHSIYLQHLFSSRSRCMDNEVPCLAADTYQAKREWKGSISQGQKWASGFILGSFLCQTDFQQNILHINQQANCVSAQQYNWTECSLMVSFTVYNSCTAYALQGARNSSIYPLKSLFNNKRVLYLELFPWSSSIQRPLSQEAFKG